MRAAVVDGWRLVFDEAYDGDVQDWSFDIRGWKGGDGREIPPPQMREWVSSTLGRVAAEKPRRLLEIGCGTGLLTWQLAPLVEEYIGLDFSEVVVEQLRGSAREHGVDNVSFQVGEASQLDALVEGEFDAIVLNSVCQYFPDEQYLGEVLVAARGRLAAGGTIYFGDVRDSRLGLHCHFDIAGQLPADGAGDAHQRLELARSRLSRESELLIDPAFFEAVAAAEPSLWCAVLPRRGWSANELTRYRYDVLLRHEPPPPAPAQRLTWGVEVHSLAELGTELLAATGPVLVDSIPNARLCDVDAQLSAAVDEAAPDRPAAGVEPEAVLALAPSAFVAEVYLDRHPCLFQAVFAPSRASLLSTRPLPVGQE